MLRAEQQRALDLLQRERAAVVAATATADERLQRVEMEIQALGRKEEDMRRELHQAQEQVRVRDGGGGWKWQDVPGTGERLAAC